MKSTEVTKPKFIVLRHYYQSLMKFVEVYFTLLVGAKTSRSFFLLKFIPSQPRGGRFKKSVNWKLAVEPYLSAKEDSWDWDPKTSTYFYRLLLTFIN